MKIAIPTAQDKLCMHFGHCEVFTFFDVDDNTKEITNTYTETPPAHAPGVIPKWVAEQKANIVLAGGMGGAAQMLFKQAGVDVVTGVQPEKELQDIVKEFMTGSLETGINTCDSNHCGH